MSETAASIPGGVAGFSLPPLDLNVDARWLMAYAAALGETDPACYDTTRTDGIVAPCLFPVCYEWPLWSELTRQALPPDVAPRGVHVGHDLLLARRVRAGETVRLSGSIIAIEPRASGARVTSRLLAYDSVGRLLSRTLSTSAFPGVEAQAQGGWPGDIGSPPPFPEDRAPTRWHAPLAIGARLAHIYSECARIWNPIHTDLAAARAAGLPDLLLHGTATAALALTELLRRDGDGAATPVRRVRARFRRPVPMPARLAVVGQTLRAGDPGRWCAAAVLDDEARHAADLMVEFDCGDRATT